MTDESKPEEQENAGQQSQSPDRKTQGQDAAEEASQKSRNPSVEQAEIDSLLGEEASGEPSTKQQNTSQSKHPEQSNVSQSDIELLLNKAEQALASIDQEHTSSESKASPGVKAFEFEKFAGTAANTDAATLELMRDVQLDMSIELGRTHMHLEDVLQLKKGAVVPLDKLAGDPVDIFVNDRLIARGEVLVLNDNFCIRVTELIVGESVCA